MVFENGPTPRASAFSALEFHEGVDFDTLSCVELHIYKPENSNHCSTKELRLRPITRRTKTFCIPISDRYEPGLYRMYAEAIQVSGPAELMPFSDGSLWLSDYQRYGESRDFEVRNL